MKPRTRRQKEVVKLSGKLPPLSEAVKEWAINKLIGHYAKRTKAETICFDCGCVFDKGGLMVEDTVICPHCGRELTILRGCYKRKDDYKIFNIVTTIGGYQVVRVFETVANYYLGKSPEYSFYEVIQNWITDSGCVTTMAANLAMGGYSFSHDSKVSIKEKSNYLYNSYGVTYPIKRVLQIIKRNGFKGEFYNTNPTSLFSQILSSPKAETLLKIGQKDLLCSYCWENYIRRKVECRWAQLKICFKHKYEISDVGVFFDYLELVDALGYDGRNPKFICPKNLLQAHSDLLKRRQKMDEAKKKERLRKENKKYQKEYLKAKAKLLEFKAKNDDIEIEPLKSVDEFYQEGELMHHCVYQCGYYKKEDSLILSAKLGNKKMETVEFSLKEFKVIQSRGVCNQDSDYHQQIINLVNENINKIKELCN